MAERTLIVRVIGDDRSLQAMAVRDQKAVAKLGTELEVTGGRFSKFSQTLRGGLSGVGGRSSLLFGSGAFLSTAALTAGLKTSIEAASDLNEQVTKSQAVFRDSSKAILDWSKTTAQSIGVSQEQALEAAGTFGNLFRSIHLGSDQTADVSKRLVQLAADLASFNNADPGQVLQDLRSGLVGEAEPLRKYGVLLSEARVQQEALKESGKTSVKSLTDQEKALARISIIFKDTATAQGDFARTSDGLANQQRILSAQIKNTEAQLGTALLPVIKQTVRQLSSAVTGVSDLFEGLRKLAGVRVPPIHIPLIIDQGDKGSTLGDIGGKALFTLGDFVDLTEKVVTNLINDFKKATDTKTADLAGQFEDVLGGFFQNSLNQALKNTPAPKLAAGQVPGFATGLTPEDILGPLIKDIPKKLQEQLLDVEIATPDNHQALIKALEKEKNSLLEALDDPRLTRPDRIGLKEKLKGVLGAISGEKDAIQSAVDQANAQRTAALEDAQQAQDEAKQKHLEQLQKIQNAREEEARRAAEVLQGKQFRALGLSASGDEIVPGIENLAKRITGILGKVSTGDLDIGSKLAGRLRAARKLINSEGDKLTKDTRAKIDEFIKAVNGGDAKEKIQGPLTRNSVFQANKIIEGLGLTPEMERIIRQRVNSFNNADVKMPRFNAPSTAGSGGAPVVVENHNTVVLDSDVVARYVTRSQQKTSRRNPVQKRGPNRGS